MSLGAASISGQTRTYRPGASPTSAVWAWSGLPPRTARVPPDSFATPAGLRFPERAAAEDTPTSGGDALLSSCGPCAIVVSASTFARGGDGAAGSRAYPRCAGVSVRQRGHAGVSKCSRGRGAPRAGVSGAARRPPHKAQGGSRPDCNDPGRFRSPWSGKTVLKEWPHPQRPAKSGDHRA